MKSQNFTLYFRFIVKIIILPAELFFLIFHHGYYREYPNQTNQSWKGRV